MSVPNNFSLKFDEQYLRQMREKEDEASYRTSMGMNCEQYGMTLMVAPTALYSSSTSGSGLPLRRHALYLNTGTPADLEGDGKVAKCCIG